MEERRQAQLMKALADVHEVVVLHGQGQVGDDRQDVARVELRRMGREHDTHGVLREHGAHLVFKSVAAHPLHQALERLGTAHVVQLRVARVFQGVHEHHLAFDVLDDAKQQGRAFLRILLALPAQELGQDFMRCRPLLQAQLASFLEERDAQSCLAYAVKGQRQENAIEHLIGVTDHRLVILLLTHDGCKVTSYF